MKGPDVMPMRLLIANRGEIAVRIARTAREMSIPTVAVYSDVDADAPHVSACDTSECIGTPMAYLDTGALLDAARRAGADTIHPGYGFLSENAGFAGSVRDAGLGFVGPSPEAIAAMGDKIEARARMVRAKVPVVPGTDVEADIPGLGFPVLVKAAGGGGGRGMRVVHGAEGLAEGLADARAEAGAAFGDARVYAERYVARPRHIEVQILGDRFGNVFALGERECSIQRRHQKVVEETPSTAVSPALRARMCTAAVRAAKAVDYVGAGTVEFLLDGEDFWFLEMNTRIQVEHPITEMVTGMDIVCEQLRIAMDCPVRVAEPRGHAIECRVIAEDPSRDWLPCPGTIVRWRPPEGPGIRVDSGVCEGFTVPVHYDPLLCKLIAYGDDREAARTRMLRALSEFVVLGVSTNLELLMDLVASDTFARGETHTDFLTRFAWQPPEVEAAAYVSAWKSRPVASGSVRVQETTPWTSLGRWP